MSKGLDIWLRNEVWGKSARPKEPPRRVFVNQERAWLDFEQMACSFKLYVEMNGGKGSRVDKCLGSIPTGEYTIEQFGEFFNE